MDTLNVIHEFMASQGWDDDSVIGVLCDYIDSQKEAQSFREFAQQRADEENAWGNDDE